MKLNSVTDLTLLGGNSSAIEVNFLTGNEISVFGNVNRIAWQKTGARGFVSNEPTIVTVVVDYTVPQTSFELFAAYSGGRAGHGTLELSQGFVLSGNHLQPSPTALLQRIWNYLSTVSGIAL